MRKQSKSKTEDGIAVDRRRFMAAVAAAGAATTVPGTATAATSRVPAPKRRPSLQLAAAEAQPPAAEMPLTTTRTGSDYMVDVLKVLNLEYIASNPGSTFRGLHESIINYGGNRQPEFLTCCHEESAIAIAHGYAKAAGRPMAALVHGTVGLQHGSMAIYNAYCDRVPILLMTGNAVDADKRRPGVEWAHSVQDGASLVRDFTKWDDQPGSLISFGESLIRAHALAATPPMAPVLIVADTDLQEGPIADNQAIDVPKRTSIMAPIGDLNGAREAVELLATAENPVIIVDRYARTHTAMDLLVEFAELVQAPVCDLGSRMNFPNTHYLNQTARMRNLVAAADFILAIEPVDLWGANSPLPRPAVPQLDRRHQAKRQGSRDRND